MPGLSGRRRTTARTDWTKWTYRDALMQVYGAYPLPQGRTGSSPVRGTANRGPLVLLDVSGYPDGMSGIFVSESLPQDPLVALRVLADSEAEIDRIRRDRVQAARAEGASWQEIGDALGVSRQSAWEHYTVDVRTVLSRNADANESLDEVGATELAVDEVRSVRRRRRSSVGH